MVESWIMCGMNQGLSFVGKWRGMMTIVTQETKGVRLQWFQDQGDSESKPANKWVQIYEYLDNGKNRQRE
jgi:hypothetical protein